MKTNAEYCAKYRRTPRGRAVRRYDRLRRRYGRKLIISLEDFVAWAEPVYTARPIGWTVVVRDASKPIDDTNLRVMKLADTPNYPPKKRKNDAAPAGYLWCSGCQDYRRVEVMSRSKRNSCRKCHNHATRRSHVRRALREAGVPESEWPDEIQYRRP